MNPFDIRERADRETASVAAARAPAASLMSMTESGGPPQRIGTRAEPPDSRLVRQIEALSARVEILERRLRSLGECAVQQYWDGRLHLPAGTMRVIIGQTQLIMDGGRVCIRANGRDILSSGPGLPAGSSLQQEAGSSGPGSWQSIAASNGTENPRTLPPGMPIGGTNSP